VSEPLAKPKDSDVSPAEADVFAFLPAASLSFEIAADELIVIPESVTVDRPKQQYRPCRLMAVARQLARWRDSPHIRLAATGHSSLHRQ